MRFFALLAIVILSSCTNFLKLADDDYYDKIDVTGKSQQLKILFSNNINGETHPCGCRQHPRGGLPQIAGIFHKVKSESPYIYIDTGDTFFTSTKIPDPVKKSSIHTAQSLAEALAKLNITFFVPGDQDFALGEEFLAQLIEKNNIPVVVSNFAKTKIKHKKWGHISFGEQDLFFIGIIDPTVFFAIAKPNLIDPELAIANTIKEINQKFPDLGDKKFILMSHSGMDTDKILASKFPELDWVIGSHSQSFTNQPEVIGKTKLVQVLSRNHYLGEIAFSSSSKKEALYKMHESTTEKNDLIPNNPWNDWLTKYKTKLEEIQAEEQGFFETNHESKSYSTFASCIECHNAQGDFWQQTAHALALQTLIQAKAQHNPNCIGCHTLGYKAPKGFSSSHNVFQFNAEKKDQNKTYLAELQKILQDISSVRETSEKKRKEKSDLWIKLDQKSGVSHNFANVQCLNCHGLGSDHPFDVGEKKKISMEQTCIKCHTTDQSPEWYQKNNKGVATTLNKTYFAKMLKKVTCPKN